MKIYGKYGEIAASGSSGGAGGAGALAASLGRIVGSTALSIGQEGGTVSLTLDAQAGVILNVRKPAGGLGVMANVTGTPTLDGFDYELTNGSPDAAGYYLEYQVRLLSGSGILYGSEELAIGAEGGTVTLGADYPIIVKLAVRKPAGGLGLVANVTGTPTASGFDFELVNGSPDVAGYYLDYEITYNA